jgi:hypothetical protein
MLRDALMEAAGGVDAVRGKLRAGAVVPPPREWEQPLANELSDAALLVAPPPVPPPSRTNWTRLVPPPVLTGHVSSLLPY